MSDTAADKIAARPPGLRVGEPAPWFVARSTANPRFTFHTAAGRYVVLGFVGSSQHPLAAAALAEVAARRALFDDVKASFFGVSIDPADEAQGRVAESLPGLRWFWDGDLAVSRLYGAAAAEPVAPEGVAYRPFWLVLDPQLRCVFTAPLAETGAVLDFVAAAPAPADHAGAPLHAPVLILPRVFEPELCRRLIAVYEAAGGHASGFMRDVDGKTRLIVDPTHKRRSDHDLVDPGLRAAAAARIHDRLIPEVAKAFQFKATRMERYLVGCYGAAEGGHFRPHRDNTTAGTAHRRFAVTINLNAEDYEGGDLSFPEFGPRRYRAPTGGAVVFSCSLLHMVDPILAGRRFAFLPFLYDEVAAREREARNAELGEELAPYVAGRTA
ncbi:2OG-Fe(II) oxygenase family protein [Caulobacter sp. UNC279MFTsu5.1]|uniref:2OG-Fe(II) oxygenase family protein n=1 Tax=Caulobacter sp. UNC279MFTsu5.1 TaxID=1502775 RepID=UPI0008E4A219|nr:2OG-Fe(II) oxygenase [Caulobacter sp. UNC279MFTsu5.1]SFI84572.1 Predicted 2-oxoglutarate-and Fe(II)-dependent dioxygenase YbiX [Caulobacter sp. UNC279MFTsu5.1]